MLKTILFGLLLISSYVLLEVHGQRRRIQIETPEESAVSNTDDKQNDVQTSSTSDNVGDLSRDKDDSTYSSIPPMKDFGSFGFPFGKPFTRPSFAGSDPFNSMQRLMSNSMFDNVPSPFRNPSSQMSFPSLNRNNDPQNADMAVDADGSKPTMPTKRYPPTIQKMMNSMFDRMRTTPFGGLQPTTQGNGNGNQRWGNTVVPSMTEFKAEPFEFNGMKGMRMQMHSYRCCINGVCLMLKAGEVCGELGKSTNNKNNKQKQKQKPLSNNQPNEKLMPGSQTNDADSISQGSEGQNTLENYPTGDGVKYINSNNGLDSYQPESGPLNHPYVAPIGVSENEANKIRNIVLERTNFHRKNHEIPELKLNEDLNNYAQEWANILVNRNLQHRKDHVYGENLYYGDEFENVGQEAVDGFYDEIALYNPDDDEDGIRKNKPTHHLTQLLWRGSTLLGVGVSKNGKGKYTIVCNYDPSGNMYPLYTKNLPKITQEQVEAGKERVKNKKKQMNTQYTVVQSPKYSTWTQE